MKADTRKILAKVRPKIASLLRSRPFYSRRDMIVQYKTHVLGLMELNVGGFYHACESVSHQLDQAQNSFLSKLDLSVTEGFLEHNLAPLCVRRDIAMLGLIYKCVYKLAHPDLCELFSRCEAAHVFHTRLQENRHTLQLAEEDQGSRHAFLRRSIFGLVRIWNRLDQSIVELPTVSEFQGGLTELVRCRCRAKNFNWEYTLSPRRVLTSEHERIV